jgi:hypothetical protein
VNYRLIADVITFAKAGIYVNPSRAAPSVVKPATTDSNRSSVYAVLANGKGNNAYALFTSVLVVTSSNLASPDPSSTFRQLSGLLCTQEWERFCAFFCAIFNEQELCAQIYEDSISISTRAKPKSNNPGKHFLHSFPLWY